MAEAITREAAGRLTPRRLAGAALTWLAIAFLAFLLGVVGAVVGVVARNVAVGVGSRTILVLLAVATVLALGYRLSRGGPRWLWLLVGALAYVGYPGSWNGKALLATAFDLTGVAAQLVDFALWMAVVLGIVLTREDMTDERIDVSRLR